MPRPDSTSDRVGRREEPALPSEISGAELDRHVRGQLSTLSAENALVVAKHLVAAGMFLAEDPERAYQHAMAAQKRAGRIAVVREAAGFAAYHTGRFDQALREFRTVRRLTGSQHLLPLIADCERGLGRPERAVGLVESTEARFLDRIGQLELLMVASGARRDMGQPDAAVLMLQVPELSADVPASLHDSRVRLMAAYADALADAGREPEATTWRTRAEAIDLGGVLRDPDLTTADTDDETEIWDVLTDDEDTAREEEHRDD